MAACSQQPDREIKMSRISAFLLASLALVGSAYAQTACPELTLPQVWVGYLSWLGFFKGLGAVVIGVGVMFFFGGLIVQLAYHMRHLLNVAGYAASLALVFSGQWVSPDYLGWTVLVGCLVFMASVFMT